MEIWERLNPSRLFAVKLSDTKVYLKKLQLSRISLEWFLVVGDESNSIG